MSDFRVVIPARHASQRLPGKPLLPMAGRPMVQWVWERAMRSGADEVLVATDHDDIATACRNFGAEVCLTDAAHASGTDRIAEVAARRDWDDDDIVVNVQGDEPLLPPALVRQVAELLHVYPDADIATLATPVHTLDEYLDPNVVKVVTRADGAALYFSRAAVPWHRDGAPRGPTSQQRYAGAMRHVGLYAYRVAALRRLADAGPCTVEKIERLEQLRALWLGMRIQVDGALEVPPAGVDTAEDAARVSLLLGDRSPAG